MVSRDFTRGWKKGVKSMFFGLLNIIVDLKSDDFRSFFYALILKNRGLLISLDLYTIDKKTTNHSTKNIKVLKDNENRIKLCYNF